LVHIGLEGWLKSVYECEVEVDKEKQLKEYLVKGRIDALNKTTVYEVKYQRDLPENRPLQHHVDQLKCYMWLTNRDKGMLIYVTPARLLTFDFESKFDDYQVLTLIWDERTPKYPDWECDYCDYSFLCGKRVVKSGR